MESGLVNPKKVERMAYLALKNGLRLHHDSIILFKNKRYPSSYFLSILAWEEIGKFFVLEDLYWNSYIEHTLERIDQEEIIKQIYSHYYKQNSTMRNFGTVSIAKIRKLRSHSELENVKQNSIYVGLPACCDLEKAKQNSMYVGLPRRKKKIDIKGRINNPFSIPKIKVKRQITTLNDKLIECALEVNKHICCFDIEPANKILNRRLYIKLRKEWPIINQKTKKRLKKLENI